MPFVTNKKLMDKAMEEGFALGAFNVNNMELIQGITEAAKELNAPLILQISRGARKYAGRNYIMKLIEAAEKETKLPIAIHLDHGDTFELCQEVIEDGFTSVMIDGSHEPFEGNIALTKKVVDYAHPKKVSVEAELGKLIGEQFDSGEGGKVAASAVYTDPNEAKTFVEKTKCDSLAVAIGTSHGAYKFKSEPKLDFERLKAIREIVKIPLVLHGSSSVLPEYVDICNKYGAAIKGSKGVPEDQIKQAVKIGVQKVNIDTDLRLGLTAGIRKALSEDPKNFDPRLYLGPARDLVKEIVKRKIKLLGCDNKADLFK
ncbi:MAG: class II fructose-1,6-bisphosphate aldolase [Nanoarchaeota archaeon]|nr:class II fructose-1,6-bisphosphate aldolase [Nanoarchaeota archaeon]MBU1004922.1 class II fructose-1,6-bisphosphate aldolase [Nanoarchaeota archaeon]MBU1945632.1 class II fructose-1,6-bisphosphate aldolase [Nanoarchaeota archaeon]